MQTKIKPSIFAIFFVMVLFAAPAGAAEVYFISPADGDTVGGEFQVQFGLSGMGVTAAGFDAPNTGHHHLLIDMDELPDLGLPLAKTDQLRHFGGGQTEVMIQLSPGKHSLQLVLANHLHIPHDPPVISKKITIEVRAE